MKALNDFVAYEPVIEEKKTDAGIIIPTAANKQRYEKGVIKYVGPAAQEKESDLTPGTTIIVAKAGASEMEFDDEKLKITKLESLLFLI